MATNNKNPQIKHIPDSDHVLRYCKPSDVVDGEIVASAFGLRTNEQYLSVNWAEYHNKTMDIDIQMEDVRADVATVLEIKSKGRFVKINVGATKENIAGVMVEHIPEPKNLSHAGIHPPNGKKLEMALELSHMVTSDDIFRAVV